MAKKKSKKNLAKDSVSADTSKKIIVKSKQVRSKTSVDKELPFNKENFKWIGIGVLLIGLGMLLMIGGFNENPAVWDESGIYGLRRTLLAPIVILAGLGMQIYAIFK